MLLPSKVPSSSGGTSTHLRRNRKRFLFSIIFAAENTFPACRGGILNFIFGAAMFFVGRVGFCFFFFFAHDLIAHFSHYPNRVIEIDGILSVLIAFISR